MSTTRAFARAALALVIVLALPVARAGEVRVAVAANFLAPATELARQFAADGGHRAVLSAGPTGQLYAQIVSGAPFDVFLAADRDKPRALVERGLALGESVQTYAFGRLVLYSREPDRVLDAAALTTTPGARIAIANPRLAPYGAAAREVISHLGVAAEVAPRLVFGNSVGQVFQFVESGNAELGFVARSQVARHGGGSRWLVPASLHAPIAQDAVLLNAGAGNPAARAFLRFLAGPRATAVIAAFGYAVGGTP